MRRTAEAPPPGPPQQATGSAAAHDDSPPTTGRIVLIFVGLVLGMLLAAVSQTSVTTALPVVAGSLGGLSLLSWIITAYLLGQTIAMPIYGKAGDLFGRRPVFQFAVCLFGVGSVLCGISQNMPELIAARAVQGLGGGGLMVSAQAIIGEIVSPRRRGRWMSFMMPVFGLGTVAGPLMGGFVVDHTSWRWIFFIPLPLGVFSLVVTALVLHLPKRRRHVTIDYAGAALLTLAVVCLVLVTSWGGTRYEWTDLRVVVPSVLAAAAVAGLVVVERLAVEPLLPPHLFRDPVFSPGVVLAFLVGIAMFAAVTYVPTYLQIVTGVAATDSGLLLVPLMGGLLGMGVVTGQLMSATGRYKVFPLCGVLLAIAAVVLLSRMGLHTSATTIGAYMALLGGGLGLTMPVLTTAVQNSVPRHDLGVATSGVNFFRQVGGALGTAVVGALFTARFAEQLTAQLPPGLARRAAAHSDSLTPAALADLPPRLQDGIVHAFAAALPPVFLYFVPALALGFLMAVLMREKPLGTTVSGHSAPPRDAPRDGRRDGRRDGQDGDGDE